MNFVIKSNRVPMAKRPLHHWHLSQCLAVLEVNPAVPCSDWKHGDHSLLYCVYRASESHLWGYLEEARNNHRRLIRQHHPDRGGSHEKAAVLNAAWKRTRELLARKGISFN